MTLGGRLTAPIPRRTNGISILSGIIDVPLDDGHPIAMVRVEREGRVKYGQADVARVKRGVVPEGQSADVFTPG